MNNHTHMQEELDLIHLPTQAYGEFTLKVFKSSEAQEPHLVLLKGPLRPEEAPILVRLHSECLTGDVFDSARCDCSWQLHESLSQIKQAPQGGLLLYLRQEGRGIGLINKLKAYQLQDQGLDTVEANHQLGFQEDERDYKTAVLMLHSFGLKKIRLLTNNPKKIKALELCGIQVERIPLIATPNVHNKHYLKTKQSKLHHLLNL